MDQGCRSCSPSPPPRHGGCGFAEDPNIPATNAALFWHPRHDPGVVRVALEKIAADHPDAFDIHRLNVGVTILLESAGEQLLLRDGAKTVRLDIQAGTLLAGPVHMRYLLSGYRHLDRQLLTVRRLSALRRLGRLPNTLFPPHPRRRRWAMILRTIDAMTDGASQRDMAAALFGAEAVERDWAGGSSYLRLRIQRLTRTARTLLDGGYLRILAGSG